jgi:hypothetical protein
MTRTTLNEQRKREFRFARQSDSNNPFGNISPRYRLIRYGKKQRVYAVRFSEERQIRLNSPVSPKKTGKVPNHQPEHRLERDPAKKHEKKIHEISPRTESAACRRPPTRGPPTLSRVFPVTGSTTEALYYSIGGRSNTRGRRFSMFLNYLEH